MAPNSTNAQASAAIGKLRLGIPETGERLLGAQDLHRLVQRRTHRGPGDRDANRAERLARLELQSLDQCRLEGLLDRRGVPRRQPVKYAVIAASSTGLASAPRFLAADASSTTNSSSST